VAAFLNRVSSLLSSVNDLGGRSANTLWVLVICSARTITCFELVVFLSYLSVGLAVMLRCNPFRVGLLSLQVASSVYISFCFLRHSFVYSCPFFITMSKRWLWLMNFNVVFSSFLRKQDDGQSPKTL
jgi:hypothetical protein